MARSPSKSETPAKAAKPTKAVDKAPKPAKPADEPVKAADKPAKAADKPVEAAAKPVKAAEKPVKAAATPAKAAEKPAKAAEKPAKAAAKPAKAAAKPAKAAAKPAEADPPSPPEEVSPVEPAVAEETPAEPWREPLAPIPDAFGEDRITVMARDPESAFAYWEVTEAGLAAARAASGAEASGLTLRVALSSSPGAEEQVVDTPVREWVGRWMLRDLRPGSHVRTQIGLAHAGGFVAVASSPGVEVPRRAAAQAPVRFVRLGRTGAASQPAPTPAGAPTGALSSTAVRRTAQGSDTEEQTSAATSSVGATPASQPKKKSGGPR